MINACFVNVVYAVTMHLDTYLASEDRMGKDEDILERELTYALRHLLSLTVYFVCGKKEGD